MKISELDRIAINNIKKVASESSPQNAMNIAEIYGSMTKNLNELYQNNNEEKDLICYHLNQKFKQVKNTPDEVRIGKNLLYFTTFYNEEYTELLEMCLNSIHATTPIKNFDVLFITDEKSKRKIENFSVLSHFCVDYLVLPTVNSAPKASIKKLSIFEYKKINNYGKILFLDVDSVCVKNLNCIFDKILRTEKLYVSYSHAYISPLLLSPTCGIMHMTDEDAFYLNNNTNINPFNAGQFLFINTLRMQLHFLNVQWIQNCWPGLYFYEQSFMNYYFVLKDLTETLLDESGQQMITVTYNSKRQNTPNQQFYRMIANSKGKNIMTVTGGTSSSFSKSRLPRMEDGTNILTLLEKCHTDSTVVIHFASISRSSSNKKTYINSYANAHQLHI